MTAEIRERARAMREWADNDGHLPPSSIRACARMLEANAREIEGLQAAFRELRAHLLTDPPRLRHREPMPAVARIRDRVLSEDDPAVSRSA